MIRAGIYTRISEDPEARRSGRRAVNCETQELDCRAVAKDLGATVVEVFSDDDITAADPEVTRPDFERLIEWVLAGDLDVVIVYDQLRFARLPADIERVMAAFTLSGVQLTAVSGSTEFESPEGRLFARFITIVGAYEVEKIKARTRRKMAANAAAGKPHGGGPGFGYRQAGGEWLIDEDEALLVKEAAHRVIAGESLRAIAEDWNERGYRTRKGNPWVGTVLRRSIGSPRVAGLRIHRGEIAGKAVWPAILDADTFRALTTTLKAPGRDHGGSRMTHLLTGFLRCGKCGEPLNHKTSNNKGPKYFCRACHGTMISGDHTENLIRDLVVPLMDGPRVAKAVKAERKEDGSAEILDAIYRVETERNELAAERGRGEITDAEWRAMRPGFEARLRDLNGRLKRQKTTSVLSQWVGRANALGAAWDGLDGAEALSNRAKRQIIESVLYPVTVAPARIGPNRFDPERILSGLKYRV